MKIGDYLIIDDLIEGAEFLAIVSAKENEQFYATIVSLGTTMQIDANGKLVGYKGDALDRYYSCRAFDGANKHKHSWEKWEEEKRTIEKKEKFLGYYRRLLNLPDGFVLTKDNVEEWAFNHTCVQLGWYRDSARYHILGEPWAPYEEDED